MLSNIKIAKCDAIDVDVPPAGIVILPENNRRFFAMIQNNSNQDIWLWFGSQGIVGQGIFVPANGFSYEIDRQNLWQGSVYGCHNGVGDKNVVGMDCY
jgi:hypothetical protein